jgi:tetratricopeptide (TPR) repeat protein
MFGSDLYDARQWLIALFVTSSFLHFYYDGFIWKVSDRTTGENLAQDAASLPMVDRLVPSMVHAGKWATLALIAAMLVAAEWRSRAGAEQDREQKNRQALEALAALTPEAPEARAIAQQLAAADAEQLYQNGVRSLQKGDAAAALEPLRKAIKLDPQHFLAHLQLGDALLALEEHPAAARAFSEAIILKPDVPDARIGLADAQIKSGDLASAEQTLRTGLARQADSPELCYTLGLLLQRTGRSAEAAELLERAARRGLAN